MKYLGDWYWRSENVWFLRWKSLVIMSPRWRMQRTVVVISEMFEWRKWISVVYRIPKMSLKHQWLYWDYMSSLRLSTYSWTTCWKHVILQKKVYWTSVFFDSCFGCLDVHPSIGSLTLQDECWGSLEIRFHPSNLRALKTSSRCHVVQGIWIFMSIGMSSWIFEDWTSWVFFW